MTGEVRREYVDAWCVLLDALAGLRPHLDAFVLIGAQAGYLRTIDRLPGYQPYTTDADLAFDPARLADEPLLADAMVAAGFVFSGQPGIWHRTIARPGEDDAVVPVDLIVPEQIAPTAGRRGARLPGNHGRTVAQKTGGVEEALVDHDPIEIAALDATDPRRVVVEVAGPAALLVAKAFTLGERVDNPRRFLPKLSGTRNCPSVCWFSSTSVPLRSIQTLSCAAASRRTACPGSTPSTSPTTTRSHVSIEYPRSA